MNWYGEIVVPESHTVDWGSIPAGIDFADDDAKEAVGGDISYIANGDYNEQIKAATSWGKEGGGDPVALSDDASTGNSFALRALSGADDYSVAVPLNASGDWAALKNDGTGTSEAGYTVSGENNFLYIKLNETFPTGVYTRSITYGIVNRP